MKAGEEGLLRGRGRKGQGRREVSSTVQEQGALDWSCLSSLRGLCPDLEHEERGLQGVESRWALHKTCGQVAN